MPLSISHMLIMAICAGSSRFQVGVHSSSSRALTAGVGVPERQFALVKQVPSLYNTLSEAAVAGKGKEWLERANWPARIIHSHLPYSTIAPNTLFHSRKGGCTEDVSGIVTQVRRFLS